MVAALPAPHVLGKPPPPAAAAATEKDAMLLLGVGAGGESSPLSDLDTASSTGSGAGTYGVFLYELLHGRTPFAGATNEETLRNIVRAPLAFPGGGQVAAAAHDLIARLLVKDPAARLGSLRGAADVKAHPFFSSLNLALLRSSRPPVVPGGAAMRRSQSCKAPLASRKPDPRFDLF